MAENTAGAAAKRSPSSPEWEKSQAAAALLWVPLAEFAAKFTAENRDAGVIAGEQARLLRNLAEHVKVFTGEAAGAQR
jgi:hypothetical protein